MRPIGLLVVAVVASTPPPELAAASPVPGGPAGPAGRAVRVDHHVADDAPAIGPRDALVTVELFFTPGQGNAHDAYRTLLALQARHPTRVRAVFRPLSRNQRTPHIVLAAHRHGRFFELMNALSAGAIAPSAAATIDLAVKVGLSRTTAERAHLDDAVQAALDANDHRKFRLGITSNPELTMNGRPLGPTVQASSATLDQLDAQYKIALDDARRAVGAGVPARALATWGERRARCDDDGLVEDGPLGRPDPGDDADADKDRAARAAEPPVFAWRLAELLARGTGCRTAPHMPATLDEYDPDDPPRRDDAPLLARPLPATGLPYFGPADATVPIFVVCNIRGRYCLDQLDTMRQVAGHFPGQVRVVWVPWVDLALDGATSDLTLAQAALCAAAEGDGWGFLRAASTAGVTGRSRVDLAVIAANANLDADALVACAAGEPRRARAVVETARAAGIGYGPTVVIGGRAYLGGFSDDRRAVDRVAAELAPGLLEALLPGW